MSWKSVESEGELYLKELVDNPEIIVDGGDNFGGSNSTISDIGIFKEKKLLFCIDVKSEESQTSQFVVKIVSNNFEFGNIKNVSNPKQNILEYLNNNFDKFKNASTSGIPLECEQKLIIEHIFEDLKFKNVKFLLCKTYENRFKIINIKNLNQFFNIEGTIRKKKSGSRPVSLKSKDIVREYIKIKFDSYEEKYEKTLLFKSDLNTILKKRFIIEGREYLISRDKIENYYQVKKLSKTNNLTVIFSLKLLNNSFQDDAQDFLNNLNL